MKIWYLHVLLFLTYPVFSQDQWKNVYSESAWKDRDGWQKAEVILKQLGGKAGSRVADIGCHEGYMTVKLSNRVGPTGTVYAIDVDQAKLDKLKRHLEARNLSNVVAVKGNFDDPHLPAGVIDAILILDTYHEMKDHDKILQHVRVSLKRGGRLVICEPIAEDRRKQSRAEQERKHELGLPFALEDLTKPGFQILFKQDPFVDREKIKGDKMWIVVATPNLSRQ